MDVNVCCWQYFVICIVVPRPYNLMIVCCKSFYGEMLFARHKNYNCRIHHVHVMFESNNPWCFELMCLLINV